MTESRHPTKQQQLLAHSDSICQCDYIYISKQACLDAEREAKDSAREAPSVIARFFATTSRASQSRQSVVLPVVVV